jgi:hypothetical protein
VNLLSPTSQKGVGGIYSPPGERDVREGGNFQSWACAGAVNGSAACGRSRFDTIYKKKMVQPLDNVQVELC